MANSTKFRADHIGSLIRPQSLLLARERHKDGMIEADELKSVEDDAIEDVVQLQQSVSIDILTDGEFRRTGFGTDLAAAFDGFSVNDSNGSAPHATGKLARKARATEREAAFLKSITKDPVKITLPAPGFIQSRCYKEGVTDKAYPNREDFAAEIAEFTRQEIEALIAEGVSYVQLDNPGYSTFMDAPATDEFRRMLDTDIAAVKDIERPEGVSIGLHVCGKADGGYDPIAESLFSELPVDRLLLGYDSDHSGGFELLRFVTPGRMVVLGVLSTEDPRLETLEEIEAMLDDAAQYVDQADIAFSPRCGFAASPLTEQDQCDKLQMVADVALANYGFEL